MNESPVRSESSCSKLQPFGSARRFLLNNGKIGTSRHGFCHVRRNAACRVRGVEGTFRMEEVRRTSIVTWVGENLPGDLSFLVWAASCCGLLEIRTSNRQSDLRFSLGIPRLFQHRAEVVNNNTLR